MLDPHQELFERARHGDRVALGELLQQHLPSLRAYVRLRAGGVVRAREESADIVQSVCRELLGSIDSIEYRGEVAFRHWLHTAALRKIVEKHDRYRAQKRDALREVEMDAAGELLQAYRAFSSPSQHALAHEELARIERAFETLPEDYREVILLARVTGLSRKEIGEQTGRSEAAVRVLLHRALARLAKELGPD